MLCYLDAHQRVRPDCLDRCASLALESPEVQAERQEFLRTKVRADRQFWTDLLRQAPPEGI